MVIKNFLSLIINIVLHIVDNLIHFAVENFVVNVLLFIFICGIIRILWKLEISTKFIKRKF